jgi:DNA-binding protein H-NS
MAKLTDLLAQKATLEKQIADAQREERSGAIAQIKALMAEHGLTAADLNSRAGKPVKTGGTKVAAKYRNKATNETWSGRGLQPRWLKAALASGKKLADFAV